MTIFILNRGGGNNFALVKQSLWTLLNVRKDVATHIDTQATYIVQSTISMQGMLMLGGLEACPQENFEKQVF